LPLDVDKRFAELEAEIERIDAMPEGFGFADYSRGGVFVTLTHGVEGLEDRTPAPSRVWNNIPDDIRDRMSRHNAKTAKRLMRKLLKGQKYAPRVMITEKLRSYSAAKLDTSSASFPFMTQSPISFAFHATTFRPTINAN
jgi:hypothetical protein